MKRNARTVLGCLGALLAAFVLGATAVRAAEESPAPATAPPAATAPAADAPPPLATSQEAIAMRYRRFEETLGQLADYLRKSDPQRAELLVRAMGKSTEGRVKEQLQTLSEVLKKQQLGDAIEREQEVIAHMQAVLDLAKTGATRSNGSGLASRI
jgi:hypothetical protein